MLDTSHVSYPTSDYKPPVSSGAPVDSDDYEDDDDHHPKSYEAHAPYPQYAGMMAFCYSYEMNSRFLASTYFDDIENSY